MIKNIFCLIAGASFGAVLRWRLAVAFNGVVPLVPMGTLIANLLGGYMMGLALGAIAFFPRISPETKIFAVTGFLGALTTFSAFSGEVVLLLQQRHFFAVFAMITLHVAGSILMTGLGVATFSLGMRLLR